MSRRARASARTNRNAIAGHVAHADGDALADAPPAWLPLLLDAFARRPDDAANARIAELEAQLRNQTSQRQLDDSLLKQLVNIQMFDGSGSRPWEDFEQEFRNKAAQIPSLPRDQWVRYLHSRVNDRALEFAKSKDLVDANDVLLTDDFELYCKHMSEAMFGDTLTKTGKIFALASMVQTGKLGDSLDFLRAKERILNSIPTEDMAGYVRAGLAMQGMEPVLLQAISPNPSSPDGLFHSYADVRKQVVAVLSVNKQLLHAANQEKANTSKPQPQSNSSWLAASKTHNQSQTIHSSQPSDKAAGKRPFAPTSHSAPTHPHKQFGKHQTATKPAQASGPSNSAQPSGSGTKPAKPNPYADYTCPDCNEKGHFSKGYFSCKANPRNVATPSTRI